MSVKHRASNDHELDLKNILFKHTETLGRCCIQLKAKKQKKFGTVIEVPVSMNKDEKSRLKEGNHEPYDDVHTSDDDSCYRDYDSCHSEDDSFYSENEYH